ncbi:MAG: phosphoethanolamine--lipid A transferase [Desulfobulbaceae bacterium]|jgi:lipid A ethanolaminephosphotransferase|nr:phosphoethanolamine--lipid A transferase [Desulfobulbaceae bacterium]
MIRILPVKLLFSRLPHPLIKSQWLIAILTLYFGFVLNLSFWRFIATNLEIDGGRMALFAISLFIVNGVLFGWIFCLTVIKPIAKWLIIPFLLVSSVTNYLMWNLGVFIDADMIRNAVQTNVHEATDLITLSGCLWFLLSGIIPAILFARVRILYRPFARELLSRLLYIGVGAGVVAGFAATSYKEYVSFFRNHDQANKLVNTINYTYGIERYFHEEAQARRVFVWLDRDAHRLASARHDRHTVLIFIIGETARAANFSLQGYERDTNPRLAKENIIYFKNMTSCGTATATSLPCMFSSGGRQHFNANDAKFTQNLLDLLGAGGYDLLWQENDGGCKDVCDRAATEDMVVIGNSQYCAADYCRDDVLVNGLKSKLSAVGKDTVIFLHTMGSHGPSYYQRYPEQFKKFTPTCDTADIQNCPRQAIINTYDNTILYTDYIISSVIDLAKEFPDLKTGVMYVSDHGESLGENNVYLHGLPYAIAPEEQTHVPFLLWMSEAMKKDSRIDYACLASKEGQAFSHDNIFHSLLGLLDVTSTLYQPDKDIFRSCRTNGGHD